MTVYLAPIGNGAQFFTSGGLPLNAGTLSTYAAGTSTPLATYTDATGATQNANPIVLNTDGRPPQEIWFAAGQNYKFILADSAGNTLGTYDNLQGVNDITITSAISEWVLGTAPTYISGTQFSITGNQVGIYPQGRRVQLVMTAGTLYGTVTASSFGTVTTVTAIMDSGSIDSGLSQVSYALLSVPPSAPHLSGEIKAWPGSVLPGAHLWCDGSSYNQAEYPGLYAVLGTTYGQAGGAGTFQVPDGRGRSLIGVGSAGQTNTYTLGQQFGEELHVLAVGELAAHNHPASSSSAVSDPGHLHQIAGMSASGSDNYVSYNDVAASTVNLPTDSATTGITVATSTTTSNTGSSDGHNTVHPSLAINWIIAI